MTQVTDGYHKKLSQSKNIDEAKATGQSRKEGKDEESIQSSTTPDPGYQ